MVREWGRCPVIASKSIVTRDGSGNAFLDRSSIGGHTQPTMSRKARALELPSPHPAALLVLGLVLILSIVVILPR